MNISSHTSPDGGTLTISVSGAFDFKCHADFRRAYESLPVRPRRVVVDLAEAEYLDSSALGMLLLLRKHSEVEGQQVTLAHARPSVSRVLAVANFHKLFQVA